MLVIERKNANKDEATTLGVDQRHTRHRETPELFSRHQPFTAINAIRLFLSFGNKNRIRETDHYTRHQY